MHGTPPKLAGTERHKKLAWKAGSNAAIGPSPDQIARCTLNTVEYFEKRKAEIEEQLAAIDSGRVLRVVQETANGTIDVTEQEKGRLRQTIHDYWRAAENLRRINSSQRNT
jgi:hypothetical protein